MLSAIDYPIFLLVVLFPLFWFSARIGIRYGGNQAAAVDKVRNFFAIILGATLTLLGLFIAFSFSMAVSRYDQRKNYEELETNAIETEYLRANLLSTAEAAKVHGLLKSYLDQRILFYETRNELDVRPINSRTIQIQMELWSAIAASVGTLPPHVAALILSGMNDVLNSEGYTRAAWWNRIPLPAWALLISISILCNFLIGYDAPEGNSAFLMVLPIALSVALFLIAEIDSPRHGFIRVTPQNLISLSDSLRSQ
jgi:hypothetical protein